MFNVRRQLMGLGFITASSVLAMGAAHAMTGQTNIKVDGGPLGDLEMSGGFAGFGYVMTNPASSVKQTGLDGEAFYLQVGKTSGVVQWFIQGGNNNNDGYLPGAVPGSVSLDDNNASPNGKRGTSFLNKAYVTIAPPNEPVTFSGGILGGLEGYESGTAWNNVSLFSTAIDEVETGNQIGVNANITEGPASLIVQFGDVAGTRVFNTLELLGNYSFDSSHTLSLFATIKTGRTGAPASGGSLYSANSNVFGGYYNVTQGNLNLVPEVQYVYAKTDHKIGINDLNSNLGVALFGDYTYANTPYSLGGWVAWDKSIGSGITVYGHHDESITLAIAPTWQYKYVYARVNGSIVHLLSSGPASDYTSWASDKKTQFVGALETGFVF